MPRKSFNEKLKTKKDLPKVVTITDPKLIARFKGTQMLVAPPMAYDEVMKSVPFGRLITADYIRNYLAKKHGADFTCPLTAGMFINIAAHASVERDTDKTPYWRTLKKDGELNEKYPDGIENQRMYLELEGHTVIQKGKKYYVKDYEKNLFLLSK
jgi:hypothetical protein